MRVPSRCFQMCPSFFIDECCLNPHEELVDRQIMYCLHIADWQPVLFEMHRISADCNFWLSIYPCKSGSGVPL